MIDETLEELKDGGLKAHESLKRNLAKLRTGRANPDLLDGIRVEYYGSPTPLNQLASVTVPEPRMLMIKVFDKANVKPVEKAIMESGLGLNPQTEGELLRVPMPPLTEERRRDLTKLARKNGEECKISIRKHRQEARSMLDTLKSDGDASEDDIKRAMTKVDEIVQGLTAEVDTIVSKKEADIMEV